jgi:hypothetical protein
MAQHYSVFTQLDFSEEKASTKIYNGAITSTSIAGFITEFGQMRDTIAAITLGTMTQEQWVGDITTLSQIAPTNEFSQRETKWKVNYVGDTSNKKFFVTLPCADPVGRMIAGTDKADLTETAMAAFVTRFNSFARTPDSDLETVTITSIQLVGRNL